jgi:phosphopantothenoylcysteine synthetase/decarboxylase
MLAIITTGPASAPIDDVRHITNFATGEIGALLAGALAVRGFQPLLLRARGATHTEVPDGALHREFTTNGDLVRALEELSETRGADVRAVFHAAALSDYNVAAVRGPDGSLAGAHKIRGDIPQIHLVLEPAAKILPRLRGWFPRAWIVGWKYELEGTREGAVESGRTQTAQKYTDATILNGDAYGPGFGLLEADQSPVHFATKREVAQFLASRAVAFAKPDK